jgi:hypothetical protein
MSLPLKLYRHDLTVDQQETAKSVNRNNKKDNKTTWILMKYW